ncbi:MAG: hypothetical protein ACTSV1_02790 [Alphaproteobacteria bacterium]
MGDFVAAAKMGMSMIQARKQAKAGNAAIAAQQQQQAGQIEYNQALRERQQRERLRRDQATKRARFGAAGVSSVGGSAQAVLNGIAEEAERNISEQRAKSQYQLDEINRNSAYRRRVNLLEYKKGLTNNMLSLGRSMTGGMKPSSGRRSLLSNDLMALRTPTTTI